MRYIWTVLLYHFLPSLKKLHYSVFPKLLGFICKIFLEVFIFAYGLERIYHGKNFLITGTNNSQIERDLERREDAIEYSNQIPIKQLFSYNQCNVRFCIIVIASSVRHFWLFFCYSVFQFIKLIAIFSKIDGFTLRKKLIVNLSNPTNKRTFFGWSPEFAIEDLLSLNHAFLMNILIQSPSLVSSQVSLKKDFFHVVGEGNRT